jgi:GT2 family glycosyltransferase
MKLCILMACYNRKSQTLLALASVYCQDCSLDISVYLVDDGSSDGTSDAVRNTFPEVNIVTGSGNLFWARSMRLAWATSVESLTNFDYYLLLNDDTNLSTNAFSTFLQDLEYFNEKGLILIGSTFDPQSKAISYGGRILINNRSPKCRIVLPNGIFPQPCDLGNANIMFVSQAAIDKVGFLGERFIHGIADYDLTLRARTNNIPVFISSNYLGVCKNDHGRSWKSQKSSLNSRIKYLYSEKGLSYLEYMYFIKSHFPRYALIAHGKLWLKTIFPILWQKLKD